uniref:Uncharacterized protein n=1 Tax=Solanum tuberosum TaxID=4113 RepID=M1B6A9_SOLTU
MNYVYSYFITFNHDIVTLLAGNVEGMDCGVLILTLAIKGQCPFIHLVSKHRSIDPISDSTPN